jgi:hypothetical protein
LRGSSGFRIQGDESPSSAGVRTAVSSICMAPVKSKRDCRSNQLVPPNA